MICWWNFLIKIRSHPVTRHDCTFRIDYKFHPTNRDQTIMTSDFLAIPSTTVAEYWHKQRDPFDPIDRWHGLIMRWREAPGSRRDHRDIALPFIHSNRRNSTRSQRANRQVPPPPPSFRPFTLPRTQRVEKLQLQAQPSLLNTKKPHWNPWTIFPLPHGHQVNLVRPSKLSKNQVEPNEAMKKQ